MAPVRLFAFDVEVNPDDFILGICVHTTSYLDTTSTYQRKLFIAEDLTPHAEQGVLSAVLDYLTAHTGACVTSYNLMGFDLPVLISRFRHYYPLGLRFAGLLPHSSLYDTMIAYWRYARNPVFCKLLEAMQVLQAAGHACFLLESKRVYSGQDAYRLWLDERAGRSTAFSKYVTEDSYNHLRLAQVLLSLHVTDGLWESKTALSTRLPASGLDEGRPGDEQTGRPRDRLLIRILQSTPVLVGPDMTTYGPFHPEDVANIPAETAAFLIERGFAVEIRIREPTKKPMG
jgi:hypothetical protein